MKKSGFTLLEVLISIFIFGIITSCVLSSYLFSFKLFRSCDTKTDMELLGKYILCDFKGKNNFEIKDLYDNGIKNSSGLAATFVDFNDCDELNTKLAGLSLNESVQSGSFDECKSKNSVKRFIAFLGINKCSVYCPYYDSYTLTIRILDNHSNTLSGVEYEKDFILQN